MSFDFNNYNIIGDYVPVDLEQYRPRYRQLYPYNVYGYNNLYQYQNYGFQNYSSQNQYQCEPLEIFSNLAPIQNNLNLVYQKNLNNHTTVEKKTADEPPDEGPMYYDFSLKFVCKNNY